ncbi:hypothetical protein ACFU76_25330 [Streptomyces sp. NPDC057539]
MPAAAVEDGTLLFSLEAEKDSFVRYSGLTEVFTAAAERLTGSRTSSP